MFNVIFSQVIQKMIEYGTSLQRSVLTTVMEGSIFRLSLQMYGCRVIQKVSRMSIYHLHPTNLILNLGS